MTNLVSVSKRLCKRRLSATSDMASAAGDKDFHVFMRRRTELPITSMSIFVRRKQSSASRGSQTTGSFSLMRC